MPVKGSRRPCSRCGSSDRYPRTAKGGGACRPCSLKKAREWHEQKKSGPGSDEYQRNKTTQARLTRFGITQAEFDRLLTDQDHKCAICRAPDPTHIDHDHDTGHVRGILCFNCNTGLGSFRDDPERLIRSAQYVIEGSLSTLGQFKEYRRAVRGEVPLREVREQESAKQERLPIGDEPS